MALVPYKSNELTVDLSDSTTMFYEVKTRLSKGTNFTPQNLIIDHSVFLDDDIASVVNYMEDIRKVCCISK